jgi:hypothetical protein
MLAWLVSSGALVDYVHPNLRSLVPGLTCNEPGIPRFSDPMKRLCRLICTVLPHAWQPCGCRTVQTPGIQTTCTVIQCPTRWLTMMIANATARCFPTSDIVLTPR